MRAFFWSWHVGSSPLTRDQKCPALGVWSLSHWAIRQETLLQVSCPMFFWRWGDWSAEWLGSMSIMEMESRFYIFIFKAGVLFTAPNEAEAPMNTVFPRTDIRGMTEAGDETKTKMSLINILPLPWFWDVSVVCKGERSVGALYLERVSQTVVSYRAKPSLLGQESREGTF